MFTLTFIQNTFNSVPSKEAGTFFTLKTSIWSSPAFTARITWKTLTGIILHMVETTFNWIFYSIFANKRADRVYTSSLGRTDRFFQITFVDICVKVLVKIILKYASVSFDVLRLRLTLPLVQETSSYPVPRALKLQFPLVTWCLKLGISWTECNRLWLKPNLMFLMHPIKYPLKNVFFSYIFNRNHLIFSVTTKKTKLTVFMLDDLYYVSAYLHKDLVKITSYEPLVLQEKTKLNYLFKLLFRKIQ